MEHLARGLYVCRASLLIVPHDIFSALICSELALRKAETCVIHAFALRLAFGAVVVVVVVGAVVSIGVGAFVDIPSYFI